MTPSVSALFHWFDLQDGSDVPLFPLHRNFAQVALTQRLSVPLPFHPRFMD